MTLSIFLLWLVSIPLIVHSLPAPRGWLISCGASGEQKLGTLKYIPDEGFISVGNKSVLKGQDLLPILTTVRYFPDTSARKYCYVIPVIKGGKYLIRTTYYYGGFDGGTEPPVFDQIIQGTKWSIVNTTEDYANGMSSYYEIVVVSSGKTLSVCLARNEHTSSSPFISALELEYLEDSMYNSSDFNKYALTTVARHSFGNEDMISFPDDQFNRLWQPFTDNNPVVDSKSSVSSSDFWNLPPEKAFHSAITTSRGKTLVLQWPPVSLPSSKFYVALYFQDNRTPSPYSWRVFSVSINGRNFYKDLNVTTNGVTVYGKEWPLSGKTEITLTPNDRTPVGPMINAGEIFQILPLAGRTLTRDVMAMEDLAKKLDNPPSDWTGDPCLPHDNSWTGVVCSQDNLARVTTLNLTGMGLSGMLPSSVGNLTAITHIWLGGNKLTGQIPEMSTLKELQTLHLENNQFKGSIPKSLGQLGKLREIFLQNNNLDGDIPDSLQNKRGINLKVSSGNPKAME
ncbi:LRR receptor-like serine/threonine-protein kinase [Tripterygium wilfordii]|uniref:LRR receptor-like serine/threonine-protein kinase n=1 Tax=Tripterygium wilfordii TaxID=458696 RepID=A0A7J7DH60_TRIWF|nr:probable LRR receptor-like serine/threonine-protein kinase At1g67720 [Tripterygium wilfordii]KAF5745628.1 LRR receptor-like serine/threonine-protein kinase [Tripterygium wilfordii]